MDIDAALQSQIRNIEATYGQPLEHWFAVVDQSGMSKHSDVVNHLKSQHGLAHGAAHRIALLARGRNDGASRTPPDPVDALYDGPRAGVRPLHDAVVAALHESGPFEIAPKKGYLSLRRRKQFAMLKPSTTGRLDLGLVLDPTTPVTSRLESAKTFNALFTHRVRITSPDQVDAQLRTWLTEAYERAE